MSVKTWREEAFPKGTERYVFKGMSDVEALESAMQKWQMLKPENLEKHNLVHYLDEVREHGNIEVSHTFGASYCALCVKYETYMGTLNCRACPLINCNKQYAHFVETGDPQPMLGLISEKLDLKLKEIYD